MSTAAAWFLYCTVVGGLLGLAAWSGEEAARSAGRPGRFMWFAAMLASVTIPGVAYFGPDAWTPPLTISESAITVLPAIVVVPPSGEGWSAASVAVKAWVVLSLTWGCYLLLSFARLRHAQRSWQRLHMEGLDVWMTRDVGPAVFGVAEPSILMPAWALELDERLRRLMLMHEEEHARAGDPQLVIAALIVLIAMPWNAALWWQLRRLRMAVEVDCDARVLRREPDRRRYGTLLLEVSRRRSGSSLVVAFAEPRAFLERRIRRIAARSSRSVKRSAPLALAAVVLFVAAFTARDPVAASDALARATPARPAPAAAEPAAAAAPVFTPYTVKPEMRNPAEVAESLRLRYPPLLAEAGIGGTAILWFFIDTEGVVVRTRVAESSGYTALDQAAAAVAATMRFSPARNRDVAAAVWVQIPITFEPPQRAAAPAPAPADAAPLAAPPVAASAGAWSDALRERMKEAERMVLPAPAPPPAPTIDLSRIIPTLERPRVPSVASTARPKLTPYTVKPVLANAAEVARALQRNYPPLLRDSGVGGTTVVWFLIDDRGAVQQKQIHRSSGHTSLDDAALAVADRMRFRPAQNEGARVPVWVQIPITFSSR